VIRRLLLAAGLALAGCSASAPSLPLLDGGPDAPRPATRQLAFAAGDSVRLEPDQSVALEVTLRDLRGSPVAGEEIRLALVNNARDASLADVRLRTDDTGSARTTLRAPSSPATFQVRATAASASEALLLVSVSSRGFGGLVVPTRYSGVRAPERLEVQLFEGAPCTVIARLDPLRVAPLAPAGATVTFGGLGAGQTFAVRGEAVGAGGEVVGRACVDGLVVSRDRVLEVPLAIADLPLRVSGPYTLDVAFDLGSHAEDASRQWAAAVRAEVEPRGGEAGYLLAAIAEAVEMRAGSAARMEFERAVTDRLLVELRADLLRRGASAVEALARLAVDTAAVARGVDATINASAVDEEGRTALVVRALALTVDPLTPDVTNDDVRLELPVAGAGEAVVRPGDRVAVALRDLPLPFAALARRAADALLTRMGVASAAEWARITMRCREVVPLVLASTGACDAACVADACNGAVDRLGRVFDTSVDTTGAAHAAVTFRFEGAARGAPGTLRLASSEPSPLTGAYQDAPTLPLTGVARLRSP
jgi:hypothetical protein